MGRTTGELLVCSVLCVICCLFYHIQWLACIHGFPPRRIHAYEINHPVRTRIDRVWDALDSWCTAQHATHQRIRGTLPATTQALLPVIVPATHQVEIWAMAARGQQPPRQPLDALSVAQFVRGPLTPLRHHWMQLKKRHDDDEGHMRHHFFHE